MEISLPKVSVFACHINTHKHKHSYGMQKEFKKIPSIFVATRLHSVKYSILIKFTSETSRSGFRLCRICFFLLFFVHFILCAIILIFFFESFISRATKNTQLFLMSHTITILFLYCTRISTIYIYVYISEYRLHDEAIQSLDVFK